MPMHIIFAHTRTRTSPTNPSTFSLLLPKSLPTVPKPRTSLERNFFLCCSLLPINHHPPIYTHLPTLEAF